MKWISIILMIGLSALLFFTGNKWAYYAIGELHWLLLTNLIGRAVVKSRDRRFENWLREATEAAAAKTILENGDEMATS